MHYLTAIVCHPDIDSCPTGYKLKIYQPTGEPYCDPSCDVDNGGCEDDEYCSLRNVSCPQNRLCPSVVQCLGAS